MVDDKINMNNEPDTNWELEDLNLDNEPSTEGTELE